MDVSGYLKEKGRLVEEELDRLVPETKSPYASLFSAARYSLLGGGKRLRPILALATVEMFEGNSAHALAPACVLEIVHTYSLIHDDLPCMDDDDFRRGKPSLHRVFPEGHAVLTGDFLLTYAFEVLSRDPYLSAEKKVRLISLLTRCAGGEGMIAGQVMDLESEGKQIDLEAMQLMHQNKTGAVITASLEFGGILADASENELKQLRAFGKDIGLAFQIIDDVLDVTDSQAKRGKSEASDLVNGKSTYVSLLGLEQSQVAAQKLLQSARGALEGLSKDSSRLIALAECMVYRKS
ncbi:MAG: polyprenyl synthetase family protein [Parachlamydiaceae bacterium]|nr:polyprenyl synthetase family protein [Parachlamydiaceae bacterium]